MGTTYYHWDPIDDCVTHESDGAGNTIVTYDRQPGQFGPLISETRNGTTYTHHYDALGSTTALTDDAGGVTDAFQYDAWGNAVSRSGTTLTPYQWVGRWGYQSDSPVGQIYIRARSYRPQLARWVSVDPVMFMRSERRLYSQPYEFVLNTPTATSDPSGREIFNPDDDLDIFDKVCPTEF